MTTYSASNSSAGFNFYNPSWHDCPGTGCQTCTNMFGNVQNTYNHHICIGNRCQICGSGWNKYGQGNWGITITTNDLDLLALKAKIALLEEEAVKMANKLQHYKDILEEFRLAIEAEQE